MSFESVSEIANNGARTQIERLLGSLGLEKRRSASDFVLPVVGIFVAGAIVGGILGLLFAPKAGNRLRQDVGDKLDEVRRWSVDKSDGAVKPTNDK